MVWRGCASYKPRAETLGIDDAERRERHSHAEREERSFCNCRARENTIVRRSASHAVLDAPRPILKRYQSSTSNWSFI
ncbi:hypothetical protein BKM09_015975 [Pseudomonas amygdali pv. morsprunorum]|nr:hypothetical protein BKM19_003895 [Pseudomonas amygdali pv. morsprunorum]POP91717.1 hypothetical protein CXB39_18045 [Pseudomonas amygdali pv. morsprunorum]POY80113.1 hypothetical protein BKM09_015975 [Pseudomonas amygdali pv. morsprunorum]